MDAKDLSIRRVCRCVLKQVLGFWSWCGGVHFYIGVWRKTCADSS